MARKVNAALASRREEPAGLPSGALLEAMTWLLDDSAPTCLRDSRCRRVYANPAFEALLPSLLEEFGENGEEAAAAEALAATADDKSGWSRPQEKVWNLGASQLWESYLARHSVLRSPRGEVLVIVEQYQPMDSVRVLRRRLRGAQDRFEDLSKLVSDWIWETDEDLRLSFLSERVLEATGRHPRELIGRPLGDLFLDWDPAAFEAVEADARAPFSDLPASLRHADGSERLFKVSGVPLLAPESGEFIGYHGTAKDITELSARESALLSSKEQAESANRAKSEFLAAVSHELRTPLNAIIGFSELIKNETFGPIGNDMYRDYIADIHGSAEHLLELINDILDVSKIEAGKLDLEEEEVDVIAVAGASARLIVERAEQNGLQLVNELPEELPTLLADARAIKQVLLNLLSNAVKFTPKGGRVTFGAEIDSNGDFLFRVRDTGIGMTEAEIEIALTPFGQVDSRLARNFEGTGLGLPLSKGMVELHGGQLEIESEPDKGTSITVRLPAWRITQP
jgi:PAS domain S-box-containing protein